MTDRCSALLSGLDGANPLAFLAALGALRTLSLALPDEAVAMSWEAADGAWRPRLWCSLASDQSAIIEAIDRACAQAAGRASFAIGDNLNLPVDAFRQRLRESIERDDALASASARIDADFLAAFGSDGVADENGTMRDTAFRTMSGAGHQHFLKFFRDIVPKTSAGHLRRTLFSAWDYADDGRGLNLRWDPLDDRRYALRWNDPSGDPVKTMRGANRLAIEALPFFPTMPTASGLATTGFHRSERRTFFTWPIWSCAIGAPVIGALLAQVESLRGDNPAAAARGVVAMYTSARITIGKFRNFTPSACAGPLFDK